MGWTKSWGRFPIWIPGRGERRATRQRARKRIRVGDLVTWGYQRTAHEVYEIAPDHLTVEPGYRVSWCQPKIAPRDIGLGYAGQVVRVAKGRNWRKQSRADRAAIDAAREAARKAELERSRR